MAKSGVEQVIQLPGAVHGFAPVLAAIENFSWRPEIQVEQIPAPGRIAPYSTAIEATIFDAADEEIGSGRLIVLHDPQGNPAWEGDFRCVSYVRADVDAEMVSDPLLAEVGWSWLAEALEAQNADFIAASGTVTSVASQSFGALEREPDRAELEIRASWTPILNELGLVPHLAAWQDLLCSTAALPPLADGIVALRTAAHR